MVGSGGLLIPAATSARLVASISASIWENLIVLSATGVASDAANLAAFFFASRALAATCLGVSSFTLSSLRTVSMLETGLLSASDCPLIAG
jgi:hypothetical protein